MNLFPLTEKLYLNCCTKASFTSLLYTSFELNGKLRQVINSSIKRNAIKDN